MAETICAGTLWAESEFQGGLTAACGPNALAMAESWAQQSYSNTVAVYQRMRSGGRCDTNGASTLSELAAQATADGYNIVASLNYKNPLPTSALQSLLAQFGGAAAIVVEVANGQALVDYLSGQGEDAVGLQFHFVCVLGVNSGGVSPHAGGGKSLPAGYWVADGDNNLMNPVVNGVRQRVIEGHTLVYYPADVLAAARPVGALAIAPRVAIPGGGVMGIPANWTDDGTTLLAPNKQPVVHGFRDFVLAWPGGWESDNWPLAAEYYCDAASGGIEPGNHYIGRGSRQDFRYRSLGCPQNADGTWKPVYRIWTGQDILALEKSLGASQQALATSESALTSAQGQVTALNSQVAALQSQIVQLQQQVAAGGDATAHAAIVALASALAALSSGNSAKAA